LRQKNKSPFKDVGILKELSKVGSIGRVINRSLTKSSYNKRKT